jgi:hypothetical protein
VASHTIGDSHWTITWGWNVARSHSSDAPIARIEQNTNGICKSTYKWGIQKTSSGVPNIEFYAIFCSVSFKCSYTYLPAGKCILVCKCCQISLWHICNFLEYLKIYALRKTTWPKIARMDEDVDNDNNSTNIIRCSLCWDVLSFSQALFVPWHSGCSHLFWIDLKMLKY